MAIPNHHIRQEVCTTRPAYRQGRDSKAVKVYTVAQESCFLLVQGVPAVGAKEDLVKLCCQYGVLESHWSLDDYPSDQYTEVYLFQYERIQSARVAKKKLDDMSFFGGVLHVCYAPEYETVQQTRDKLQQRRKAVAARIRQNAKESSNSVFQQSEDLHQVDNVGNSESGDLKHISNVPNSGAKQFSLPTDPLRLNSNETNEVKIPQSSCGVAHQKNDIGQSVSVSLPCPPQYLPLTYPSQTCHMEQTSNDTNSSQRVQQHLDPSSVSASEKTSEKSVNHKNDSKMVNGIVVREYKVNKPMPKFIPRQTIKKSHDSNGGQKKDLDEVNTEIRRNAFTLGASQGPKAPDNPGEWKKSLIISRESELSVNSTVKNIRKQVSKFTCEPPVKKIKK